MSKLTKAQRKAMEWVRANEPVSKFPCDGTAPNIRLVTKLLVTLGYVEKVGIEPGPGTLSFSKFALTDAGRAALSQKDKSK